LWDELTIYHGIAGKMMFLPAGYEADLKIGKGKKKEKYFEKYFFDGII